MGWTPVDWPSGKGIVPSWIVQGIVQGRRSDWSSPPAQEPIRWGLGLGIGDWGFVRDSRIGDWRGIGPKQKPRELPRGLNQKRTGFLRSSRRIRRSARPGVRPVPAQPCIASPSPVREKCPARKCPGLPGAWTTCHVDPLVRNGPTDPIAANAAGADQTMKFFMGDWLRPPGGQRPGPSDRPRCRRGRIPCALRPGCARPRCARCGGGPRTP